MNFARKSLAMVSILMGVSVVSFAQNKPTDIRPKHWATEAVSTVLNNKVMDFSSGTQFRGEAQVTRTEAVIALAKLAKCVETGTWKIGKIEPISGNAESLGTQSNWTKQPVTRFILAKTLASIGNYITAAHLRERARIAGEARSALEDQVLGRERAVGCARLAAPVPRARRATAQ